LIAGDSGGNVGTGSKSQGYFKSGATYWPGIATFSILTDNAEAAPAAVPKINSFGIVENADDRVSKLNSYGIVEATGEGVSKINSYAIVQGASGVSKMNGYAVVTALPASGPASVFFQPFTHP
jgi:hypothetical protein